jgi:hypothetical protein
LASGKAISECANGTSNALLRDAHDRRSAV